MTVPTVGLLHPGSMGAAFGAQLREQGVPVLWCPEGRSRATRLRAEAARLEPAPLREVIHRADLVLSLCPPAAAEATAARVATCGLDGSLLIEANAITPSRVRRITQSFAEGQVVDAAVIGSPPVDGKSSTLYLSGPLEQTRRVEALFVGTSVHTRVLGEEVGTASALKLAYSSFQKTSRVLATLAYAAAESHGVGDELLAIGARRAGSYLTETSYIPKTASRAWRWGPELADAAAFLADAGLPDGLSSAAAEILAHWEAARDKSLTVDEAIAMLRSIDN
ncbi:DUF1932 domain-containing protein [Streptomyces sp. NPDC059175]|uniref:NAD(P)-dependent oxidoreductase n=1 Tax=unclassified Streptomyces TaxID=2593676 RepID=UPI0036CDFCB1